MRRKKNFFPALLLTVILWLGWFYVLLSTPPSSNLILITFHLFLFFALFFTFSLLLGNTRRGFLISTGIIIFLILRLLKTAHFLNLTLLLATLFTIDFYLKKH